MHKIPYPYQKIDTFATFDSIKIKYEQLLQQGQANHFLPFLLDDFTLPYLRAQPDFIDYQSINLTTTMANYFQECAEYIDEDMTFDDLQGHDPCEQDQSDLFYLQGEPSHAVFLQLPTLSPWEIPFYFSFDHWRTAEQVSLFQHWYEEYKVYPAYATENSWSFYVQSPPRSTQQATNLLREHLTFSGIAMLASICPQNYIQDLQRKKIWTLFY